MPWAVVDVDRHRKGLGKKQKKTWVKTANDRLRTCLAEGGKQQSCEASAIKIANSIFEKDGKRKT